jgi:hypothetical protein
MKAKTIFCMAIVTASISAHAAIAAVQPQWETYSCDYEDLSKDISLSGRCHKQQTEINGNFAYILTWPSGNKVTVEYVKSQSGNHIWKLNGESAVAVEINRENLRGFTLDLNQIIEWQDNS